MSDCLSEELMVEIFTRLPPKSLIRFRSLSKSWCCLISSSDFISMHTRRYAKQTPHKVLIRHINYHEIPLKKNRIRPRNYSEYRVEESSTSHSQHQLPVPGEGCYMGIIGVKFPSSGWVIVGSCNGIICVSGDSNHKITLWNPSIMRKIDLPRLGIFGSTGFGFDPITNDYKVVWIPHVQSKGIEVVSSLDLFTPDVYTIKTGVWSKITSPLPPYFRVKSIACFFNGALHWVVLGYTLGLAYYLVLIFSAQSTCQNPLGEKKVEIYAEQQSSQSL